MITTRAIPPGMRLHPDRRFYLGASEVPAAAGVDEYKSPLQLYAEKTGLLTGVPMNSAMRRGVLLEGAALDYLTEDWPGLRIVRPNIWITDDETRLACTPDALAEDEDDPGDLINVQVKVVAARRFNAWDGVPPIGYRVQVACENMLLDAARGLLAVLVMSEFDARMETFDVPRHADAEEGIREVARRFWRNIAAGRQPTPDYSRDGETIAALFPKQDPGKVIDLSGDNRLLEILPRREDIKDAIDGYKKEMDGLDAEIKHKLGDAEIGELPGWRISWKEEHKREYTVAESWRRVLRVSDRRER